MMAKPKLLVDSNVLLDIFTDDPVWFTWSEQMLSRYARSHDLIINEVIYTELSVSFKKIEDLEASLRVASIALVPSPKEALFLAGKVFLSYRKRGGTKVSTLPDFFIGAQAAVQKLPLLTRDTKRYKTYYPTLNLISPA